MGEIVPVGVEVGVGVDAPQASRGAGHLLVGVDKEGHSNLLTSVRAQVQRLLLPLPQGLIGSQGVHQVGLLIVLDDHSKFNPPKARSESNKASEASRYRPEHTRSLGERQGHAFEETIAETERLSHFSSLRSAVISSPE